MWQKTKKQNALLLRFPPPVWSRPQVRLARWNRERRLLNDTHAILLKWQKRMKSSEQTSMFERTDLSPAPSLLTCNKGSRDSVNVNRAPRHLLRLSLCTFNSTFVYLALFYPFMLPKKLQIHFADFIDCWHERPVFPQHVSPDPWLPLGSNAKIYGKKIEIYMREEDLFGYRPPSLNKKHETTSWHCNQHLYLCLRTFLFLFYCAYRKLQVTSLHPVKFHMVGVFKDEDGGNLATGQTCARWYVQLLGHKQTNKPDLLTGVL